MQFADTLLSYFVAREGGKAQNHIDLFPAKLKESEDRKWRIYSSIYNIRQHDRITLTQTYVLNCCSSCASAYP